MSTTQETRRIERIQKMLEIGEIDMDQLRKMAWHGLPTHLRSEVWQILLGHLPVTHARRQETQNRKREEYAGYIPLIYDQKDNTSNEKQLKDLKQIDQDLHRTQPDIPLFRNPEIQEALRRVLFIWAVRHPASGYVQGINDLCSIFILVFLQPHFDFDIIIEDTSIGDCLAQVEADTYWCLTRVLDGILDYFIPSTPGIQRALLRIEEIVCRVDADLHQHMKNEELQMLQFAYRWFNCMLVRELPINLTFKLWDTYISEIDGFAVFNVYCSAALLLRFSTTLKTFQFGELVMFLQNLPTQDWTEDQLSEVLSQAYIYQSWFQGSPHHLKPN